LANAQAFLQASDSMQQFMSDRQNERRRRANGFSNSAESKLGHVRIVASFGARLCQTTGAWGVETWAWKLGHNLRFAPVGKSHEFSNCRGRKQQ
jgi:hypothetical protein